MVVPFGISVGDFVAAGNLIGKIVMALNNSRGSANDYKELLSALSSMDQCLRTTSAVVLSLSFERSGQIDDKNITSIANGIKHELDSCKRLLENFLISSRKYAESLLPTKPGRKLKAEWDKVVWFIYKKEDISRLERDLKSHIQAFQLYALAFCCQTSAASTKLLEDGMATNKLVTVRLEQMSNLLKSLTESIPNALRYNWQGGMSASDTPIRFSDALGRDMFVPLIFCSSLQTFHDILLVLFKNRPGLGNVQRKQYALQDGSGASVEDDEVWREKASPGATISMSVLLQLSARSSTSHACPRCRTPNTQQRGERMIQCSFCQLFFEILEEEKSRIVEMVEELCIEDEPPIPTSQNVTARSNQERPKRRLAPTPRTQEDSAFKRISYIRQKQRLARKTNERRISDSELLAYSSASGDANPIFTNAKFGDVKSVKKSLDEGFDVNLEHTTDGSLLQQAARSGSPELVQLVLDHGANVNACGGHWGTALQAGCAKAAHPSTINVVKLLLESGADVTVEGGHYGNALQAAAAFYGLTNNSTIVELLIDAGADVNASNGEYGNALSIAAFKGTQSLVKLLVDRGADINAPCPWGSAIQAAISTDYGGGDEVARLLVEYGADLNIRGGDCGSPLHCAVMKNKLWAVELLVENDVDVNMAVDGRTALEVALSQNSQALVNVLKNQGAHLPIVTPIG